jgi:hypothetical protein
MRNAFLARAAIAIAGAITSAAYAQNVLTRTNWTFSYPPPVVQFNASGSAQGNTYPASAQNAVVRAGATGTATQNFYIINPDQSKAAYRTNATQTFTLSQQSVVQVPFFYKGTITFFGGGTNDSAAAVSGGVNVLNAGSAIVYNDGRSELRTAAQGNTGTNLFGLGTVILLPAPTP